MISFAKLLKWLLVTLVILTCLAPVAGATTASPQCKDVNLKRAISGSVFWDMNGNGVFDKGEPGIGCVTINLYDAKGKLKDTQRTNLFGVYYFNNLAPGKYTVKEAMVPDYVSTTPDSVNVEIKLGTTVSQVNFGDMRLATIKGSTYLDKNRNGKYDRWDTPLAGWNIQLSNTTYSASAVTDSRGRFLFTNLWPGTYTIAEQLRQGYTNTTSRTVSVSVKAGQTLDLTCIYGVFGNIPSPQQPGSIEGLKYLDANKNKVYDQGDTPLQGWTINLANNSGNLASQTTDANGHFIFPGLAPGDYTVSEVQQSGYENTTPDTIAVTLSQGQNLNITATYGAFGNAVKPPQTGTIEGLKYLDSNKNGAYEPGETPLADWTITITNGNDYIDQTVTTTGGFFQFVGLQPGLYTVSEVMKSGYTNTSPSTVNVNLQPGEALNLTALYGAFGNVEQAPVGPILEAYDPVIQDMYGPGAHVIDANNNGLLDWSDLISYVQSGQTITKGFTGNEIYDLQYRTSHLMACYAMNDKIQSGKITFQGDPAQEHFNTVYWQQVPMSGTNYWQVKPGVNPSDAINDVFDPDGGNYDVGCSSASNLLAYKALLDTIGAEDFNNHYGSLMMNGFDTYYQPAGGSVVHRTGGGENVYVGDPYTQGSSSMLRVGDDAYFYNPAGGDGQNAVYIGKDTNGNPVYFGHPYGFFVGDVQPFGNLSQQVGHTEPDTLASLDVTPETTWDP